MAQRKTKQPPLPSAEIPLERWRALYDAADAFYRMAPWEWMSDDLFFAVQDPQSGEAGYCSIMGALGEHLALGVYVGPEGLRGYEYMRDVADGADPVEVYERTRCLMISFEDRELLEEEDRRIIKALGRRYRGSMAWPLFRSYRPGYLPWYLEPAEAESLLCAMEQAMGVAARIKEDPFILKPPKRGQLLLRAKGKGGKWEDQWFVPERMAEEPLRPVVEEQALAHLRGRKGVPRQGTWQLDYCGTGAVIAPPGERPYMTQVCLVAETGMGLVMGVEVMPPRTRQAMMPAFLLGLLASAPVWPAHLQVRHAEAQTLIAPVAEAAGIAVQRRQRLPAADAALASLSAYMG